MADMPFDQQLHGSSPMPGAGAGPLGDWLREPQPPWGSPGPVPQPWPGPAPFRFEPEPERPRWTAATVAPWVVAGLLCAVLIAGRGQAPGAAPAPAVAPAEAVPAAPEAAAPGCAGTAP